MVYYHFVPSWNLVNEEKKKKKNLKPTENHTGKTKTKTKTKTQKSTVLSQWYFADTLCSKCCK